MGRRWGYRAGVQLPIPRHGRGRRHRRHLTHIRRRRLQRLHTEEGFWTAKSSVRKACLVLSEITELRQLEFSLQLWDGVESFGANVGTRNCGSLIQTPPTKV